MAADPTASDAGVDCSYCGSPVKAKRGAHSPCFPELRQPELVAEDPARCTIVEDGERCPAPKTAGRWCHRHYVRWQRTGHPLVVRTRKAANTPCIVADCDGTSVARRDGEPYCRKHYTRLWRRGTLELVRRQFTYTGDLSADFWRLVDTCGGDADSCWLWQGTVSVHGYGSWMHSPAHRFAYAQAHGVIPPGLVLDHICHDPATCSGGPSCLHRRCVNPTHLKAVPQAENVSPHRSSNGRPHNDRCSVRGCGRPYLGLYDGKPLCSGHAQRYLKHGDVFADRPFHCGKRLIVD